MAVAGAGGGTATGCAIGTVGFDEGGGVLSGAVFLEAAGERAEAVDADEK